MILSTIKITILIVFPIKLNTAVPAMVQLKKTLSNKIRAEKKERTKKKKAN